MRRIFWLGTTFLLFAATLGLMSWSDFKDLSHQREWEVTRADDAEGRLAGLRVGVREAHASLVDSSPDRTLVHVRFELQGAPEAAKSWVDCSVSLRGAGGEKWLPIRSYFMRGAIRILAPDGKDNGSCNFDDVSEERPSVFDEIYRLPAGALDKLTVQVSGYGTRPAALAFEIEPTVRNFKSE